MNAQPSDFTPTETNHFKVHYAPWIGFTLLPIGVLNLFVVLWLILLEGKFNSGIITGVACTVAGYFYCTRPYFSLAPNRLTIYNLIGSTIKRYPLTSFHNLQIEGKRLYIASNSSSQREKVKVTQWLTKATDWQKLETIINTAA